MKNKKSSKKGKFWKEILRWIMGLFDKLKREKAASSFFAPTFKSPTTGLS